MEEIENNENNGGVSAIYLLFTFIMGISIAIFTITAGVKGLNFWVSIAAAGLAQTLFRLTKRIWKGGNSQPSENSAKARTAIESWSTVKIYVLLYFTMVAVSALWYGIGTLGIWFSGVF